MQDSDLRPGSIPGPPITHVFVAVVHGVTNNNNSIRSLFNLVNIGHVSYKNRNSGRRSLPGCRLSQKGANNESKYTWYNIQDYHGNGK